MASVSFDRGGSRQGTELPGSGHRAGGCGEQSPGSQWRPHRRPCLSACVWNPYSPLPLKEALLVCGPSGPPLWPAPGGSLQSMQTCRVALRGLSPLVFLLALCAVELEARQGSVPRATSVGEAACLI